MSDITFTYTVAAVDEAARCMEVIYTSAGRQTMHIGTRLPFEGESLEDVILAFAPIAFWKEQVLSVIVPVIGLTGEITVPEFPAFMSVIVAPENQPIVSGAQEL